MRYLTTIGIMICLAAANLSAAADPPDPLAAKKEFWRKRIEQIPFRFPESDPSALASLSQYGGDCKIHMIYDPKESWGLEFRFERGDKDILTLHGHQTSVFRTVKNVLYFAHFPTSTCGCTVAAYDLTTGKKLWATELNAAGNPLFHSAYENQVMMGLSSEETILITGRESFGDYLEVLDRESGKVVAHKIFRQGFGSSK